jgi:cell division protease FtsH
MCATLAGRAAEELFLGRISTGAANDLERVTKQAYAMVVYYGMSENLPNISYYDSTGQAYGFSKPYSDQRAMEIDKEVSRIINEQYQRAKDILQQYAEGHNKLAEVLYTREVIFTEDVEKIFGKRKWTSRTEEILAAQQAAEQAEVAAHSASSTALPPIPGTNSDVTSTTADVQAANASADVQDVSATEVSSSADTKTPPPAEIPPIPKK